MDRSAAHLNSSTGNAWNEDRRLATRLPEAMTPAPPNAADKRVEARCQETSKSPRDARTIVLISRGTNQCFSRRNQARS